MSAGRPRIAIPYEAQVFGRMAVFGLGVGAAYWFLTYESAGSVMLVGFGLASAVATAAITLGARRGGAERASGPALSAAGAADSATAEPLLHPGWTPIAISIGLGGLALGLAFGPWLLIAGLAVTILGAKAWLDTAMAETDAARGGPRSPDRER